MTLPTFINPDSGSAAAAMEALRRAEGLEVRTVSAPAVTEALRTAVATGARRVVVVGGDGTMAQAAAALAGTETELAVVPGGTLNHFARNHGIPTDPEAALRLAVSGSARPVDVGYVNQTLFLNTSSVGVYVRFVRTRDRLQPFIGYWLASLLAGLRILPSLRRVRVTLDLDGSVRVYQALLVFVGVGERVLTTPGLGRPAADGRRGLHVVVPRGRRQARSFSRAYARQGREGEVKGKSWGLDTEMVERVRLEWGESPMRVALDGETRLMAQPLEYRLGREALRLVLPER